MNGFCRDCLEDILDGTARCAHCGSRRVLVHRELDALSIAHIDCDAFYAAVEKRDDPSLRDKPVIVGGRTRGVVMTACYIARIYGVRSAMPMFQARKLCPQAVIVKPRMAHYAAVARDVRSMMRALTPLVEPLSLDEAYLDLSGTRRLHGLAPAKTLARFARRIETEIGISLSVGLSFNKSFAKLASESDKPRGFAVIGHGDASAFLREKPVGVLRGAGAVLQARLARDGITRVGQLQDAGEAMLSSRYGSTGRWLWAVVNGNDVRTVSARGDRKTISSETTFDHDLRSPKELERVLWRQSERVSSHAKDAGVGGRTVVLKLKTSKFKIRTRSASLDTPTQLADTIFRVARDALKRETDGTAFRLLGVGLSNLAEASACDAFDLIGRDQGKRAAAERAVDKLRTRFGEESVGKGRSLSVSTVLGKPFEPAERRAKREVRIDQRHRRNDSV